MKKLFTIIFVALLIVGCSSKGYSKLTNGDDVLFSTPEGNYTRNDLYKSLKVSSQAAVENDIINKIADANGIDYSDALKQAEELYQYYVDYGQEAYIAYQYGSKEGFIKGFTVSEILAKYADTYIRANITKYTTDDKPFKMQLAHFDTIELANQVIEDVTNNGKTFDQACIDAGYTTSTESAVYLDSDQLPLTVKDYINGTDKLGLSTVITVTDGSTNEAGDYEESDTYYVLSLDSKDYNDFLDEYVALRVASLDQELVEDYVFQQADVKFYDQDIYEMMKAAYEVLK